MKGKRSRNQKARKQTPPAEFGAYLRAARLERNLAVDDLHVKIRVSITMIEALENEDFEALPADVYAKGFVKSCASALELDDVDLLRRYEAARGRHETKRLQLAIDDPQEVKRGEPPVTPEAAVQAWSAAAERKARESGTPGKERRAGAMRQIFSGQPRRVSLGLVVLLIIIVLTLTLSYVFNRPSSASSPSSGPAANETANVDWTG
ncbi:MAG: helix-turn-helix domain-containing protein [Deltaproteobacteria bacterium]|nr:helix-turn-helix domain-containing protein [Deltaproteobacteria bacterium]